MSYNLCNKCGKPQHYCLCETVVAAYNGTVPEADAKTVVDQEMQEPTCGQCRHWFPVKLPTTRGPLIMTQKIEPHGVCRVHPPQLLTVNPGQGVPMYPTIVGITPCCSLFTQPTEGETEVSLLASAEKKVERLEAQLAFAVEQVGNVQLASGERLREALDKIG